MSWLSRIAQELSAGGAVVRVTVIRAEGSTPRETGAAMLVTGTGLLDTIGGGALEFEAIAHARGLLSGNTDAPLWRREWRDFALGPSLGQCCGGAVRLMFERFADGERPVLEGLARAGDPRGAIVARPVQAEAPLQAVASGTDALPRRIARAIDGRLAQGPLQGALLIPGRKGEPDWFVEPLAPAATPLVIYGAGHVGRALVRVLEGLPFAVTWVDADAQRFPHPLPGHVAARALAEPAAFALEAPAGAFHIVMTHSHALDLAICHAVLAGGAFGHLGLIGSQTKRARFAKRLAALGIGEERLARLVCPIGLAGIAGKQPSVIAVAIAAQLLSLAR